MTDDPRPEPSWIALVEVRPLDDCDILGDAVGAFAHFVARCRSRDALLERLERRCDEEGLELVAVAWVQDADRLIAEGHLAENVRDVLEFPHLVEPGAFVGFHTWERDDDASDVA
ncbi:MAG: hypothetical protein R3F34_11525 [Planctomycetota bacterium]